MANLLSLGIERVSHIAAFWWCLWGKMCLHVKLSSLFHTILMLMSQHGSCTLYSILLLKHSLIASHMINFVIIRVKATKTNDPLCSTFTGEELFEAIEKYLFTRSHAWWGWTQFRLEIWIEFEGFEKIKFTVIFLKRYKQIFKCLSLWRC